MLFVSVSIAYFLGTRLGFAFTVKPHPVSALWPPNAILLAGLLLTPVRYWSMMVLAALPAHLAAEWESGVPLSMVLCWFLSNACEALLGAAMTRSFVRKPLAFDHFRNICAFLLCGALLAPLLASFLDAALVRLNHWTSDPYWEIWRMRFFSNVLAATTFGTAILTWASGNPRRKLPGPQVFEGGVLVLGLLTVNLLLLHLSVAGARRPGDLWPYASLPFLLWAALRFGVRGASAAILIAAVLAVWSIVSAAGPFMAPSDEQQVRAVQIFFTVMSFTLMPLASALEEREKAQTDLRASEERYREVVECQPDLVCRFFPDTTLSFVNRSYCAFFQRSREDLIGRKFLDLVPVEAREQILLNVASVIAHRRTLVCEHEVNLPGGGIGWQQWINHPILSEDGQIREIQAIGRDVTDRRRTMAALQESQEQNRAILKAIPDSIFLLDKAGLFLDCHIQEKGLLLIPPEQCLERHARDVLPEKLAEEVQRGVEAVFRTGQMALVECVLVIGGEDRCYEARLIPCGPDRILSLVRDMTQQKQAGQALKESEERYREVVESQTELVSRYKPDTTLTFANEAYARFFGQSPKKMIGRKLLDFLPSAVRVKVLRSLAEVMVDRRVSIWEHLFTLPDGNARWVQWTNYGITDANGDVKEVQGIGKDITDRKGAEEARQNLMHASRLAIVGEFTAMIAHEVNQPLGAILTNTEAAKELLNQDPVPLDEVRGILPDIHRDVVRAGETVHRLRALAQRRKTEMQLLDLNKLIEDVVMLAGGDAARRHVQILTELAPQLPEVRGDPVHLQHLLLNLIFNGMDAMRAVPEGERVLVVQTQKRGDHELLVAVKDVGHGIPAAMIPRVFESFFSTKEGGVGLGLSIARTIVEAHRGRIWVVKNPHRGVTFNFALPLDPQATHESPQGGEEGEFDTQNHQLS
jgi:PAS domain S-box-containing protein